MKTTKAKINSILKKEGLTQVKSAKSGRVKSLRVSFGDFEVWGSNSDETLLVRVNGRFAHKVEVARKALEQFENVVVEEI